ncbi:MAG: cytochrome c [Ramlibacter sp.]
MFNKPGEETMKKIVSAALATLALGLAGFAVAQSFQKPEDAVKYRKATMTVMATHFGTVAAMANGRVPYDAAAATRSADIVATMATLHWAGFTPGTDKGETRAKPEIWSDAAKFKESGDKLAADTARLATAAKTGNLDNLKAAFGPTANNCKSCHDAFRKD